VESQRCSVASSQTFVDKCQAPADSTENIVTKMKAVIGIDDLTMVEQQYSHPVVVVKNMQCRQN
jgi:hypothetical protein